jgi:hypothetical protein
MAKIIELTVTHINGKQLSANQTIAFNSDDIYDITPSGTGAEFKAKKGEPIPKKYKVTQTVANIATASA